MRQDADDFVAFVESTSARLLRAAWLMSGSPSAAEELVQTTYEKVYVSGGGSTTGRHSRTPVGHC